MRSKQFNVVVIDKDSAVSGFIFKTMDYYLTLRFTDNDTVLRREVSLQQYHDAVIGKPMLVTMYHSDRRGSWYFTAEEASLA